MIFFAFLLVCGKKFLPDKEDPVIFGEIILVRKKAAGEIEGIGSNFY